ncbi:MAG: 50S ribosomal protein L14 [Candidatus Woesearchaeota archaeon]|nr:50S ribosomal protein L14 [Candidatus Woesearchaeota archaeon]
MQALKARVNRGLQQGSSVDVCDNSGAKLLKVVSVINTKNTKGRRVSAGVADLILASVKRGKPEMRKQVVYAVIVRQRKEYRRPDGLRVKFEDNAAVVLKDEKGNPKGTLLKGPIAKEIVERWPMVAKIATIVA